MKALRAPGLAGYSRHQIEELEEHAKTYGAAGLAWMKCGANGLAGGVSRFYQAQQAEIQGAVGAQAGDLLVLVAAPWRVACTALGAVRSELARREGLAAEGAFQPCFVTDFPLFAWNAEAQRWDAEHHMFSNPQAQYLDHLEQDPAAVRGELYDAVINGIELASARSGSTIRRCNDAYSRSWASRRRKPHSASGSCSTPSATALPRTAAPPSASTAP